MQNEIIVNADPGEVRVAFLERSRFTELHIERERDRSVVGNVVKGKVTRVLPGMQAAFVDIGLEKAAFLYAGDYYANGFPGDGPMPPESGGKGSGDKGDGERDGGGNGRGGRGRRRRRTRSAPPRIDTMLREGQEIVVQIAKQPIGSKGARIISHLSIPGRHLVLTPDSRRVGVSRRISSDKERRRLREIVERLRPKELGFIIRTAGDGVREADIEADIRYLASVWETIQARYDSERAPAVLHSEPDLPLRIVRDHATEATKRIVVDSETTYEAIRGFIDQYVADPKPRIEHYQGQEPIFDAFSLEAQIHANLERKVFLKSGGSLVIDQSEALTAIDVNTGRYVGKRDLEETVFKNNLEAVKEVVHQLRFRNIGGLIIIDLIDMDKAEHREKVYRALQEAVRADKARTNILKISELGLVEMTRKRTRENLVQTLCEPCANCEGRGYVLSRESVAFRILREVRRDLPRFCGRRIALAVSPQVAEQLLGTHGKDLAALGEELGREIEVRARPGVHQEQFEVTALDAGPPVDIPLKWLDDAKPDDEAEEVEEAGEVLAAEATAEAVETAEAPETPPEGDAAPAPDEEAAASPEPAPEPEPASEPEAPAPVAEAEAESESESSLEAEPDAAAEEPGDEGPAAPEAVDAEEESRILPPSREPGSDAGPLALGSFEEFDDAFEPEVDAEPEARADVGSGGEGPEDEERPER